MALMAGLLAVCLGVVSVDARMLQLASSCMPLQIGRVGAMRAALSLSVTALPDSAVATFATPGRASAGSTMLV